MRAMITGLMLATACGLPLGMASAAAPYPEQPIRLIVPFSPGGTPDVLARLLGRELNARWGQPVVVENMPGAAGNIATAHVARAAPDGYTCLMGSSSGLTINPHLYKKLPYDVKTDLVPVSQVATTPLLLVTNQQFEAKSVADFIELAHAAPGRINYASPGVGTPHHLSMVLLEHSADIELVHVAYKGTAPSMMDLMAGHVSIMFETVQGSLQNVRDGKLRVLAVSSAQRLDSLPDVPTVAEAGVKGFEVNAWYGIVCPAGTPPEIVDKLQRNISEILQMDSVVRQLREQELVPVGNTAREFADVIDTQSGKWGKVIEEAQISIQ